MSEKIVFADVSECALRVCCPTCGSSCVLDFSRKDEHGQALSARVPEMCPGCGALTEKARPAVEKYKDFLASTMKQPFHFSLAVKLERRLG